MTKQKYLKPYAINHLGVPNSHILSYKHRERKTNHVIFFKGQRVEPQDFDLVFHSEVPLEKQIQYDCIPNNASVLLMNERALKVLQDICPNDFQAFDATIVSDVGVTPSFKVDNYKLINITKTVDAFDPRIDPDKYSSTICGFTKSIFKENSMGDVHLAREVKFRPVILCSDVLRKAFIKEKIRGVKFLKDKDD